VITGELTTSSTVSTLRSNFKSGAYASCETPLSTGNIGYTINNSYPSLSIAETDILTVTYYDNYGFMTVSGFTSGFGSREAREAILLNLPKCRFVAIANATKQSHYT
jgi:hypothetical protein